MLGMSMEEIVCIVLRQKRSREHVFSKRKSARNIYNLQYIVQRRNIQPIAHISPLIAA